MSDQERLPGYVEAWWHVVDDFATLLEETSATQGATPSDLPGRDVHTVTITGGRNLGRRLLDTLAVTP